MSNKNKALTALKRKKFKTGGGTGTTAKRTGPSNLMDLDNPNKDYFKEKMKYEGVYMQKVKTKIENIDLENNE